MSLLEIKVAWNVCERIVLVCVHGCLKLSNQVVDLIHFLLLLVSYLGRSIVVGVELVDCHEFVVVLVPLLLLSKVSCGLMLVFLLY